MRRPRGPGGCPHWRLVVRDEDGVALWEEPYASREAAGEATRDVFDRGDRVNSASVCAPSPGFGECVYFIAAAGARLVKIGTTKNVPTRLARLQTGSAHRLVLLATIHGGRSRERGLHARFHAFRAGGEWFRCEGEFADFVRDLVADAVRGNHRPRKPRACVARGSR